MTTKTTPPVVTRVDDRITVEWDIITESYTAYESILIERTENGAVQISGRSDGPVAIPVENVGLVMSLVAELVPEAVAA